MNPGLLLSGIWSIYCCSSDVVLKWSDVGLVSLWDTSMWDTKQLQPGLSWIRSVWSHVHDSYSTLWTQFQTGAEVLDHLKSSDIELLTISKWCSKSSVFFFHFSCKHQKVTSSAAQIPSFLSQLSCMVMERSVLLANCANESLPNFHWSRKISCKMWIFLHE